MFTMAWSWALVFSCAFALIFASEDGSMLDQREVTFDIEKILQDMNQPEPFMQKEVDLEDLLDPMEFNIEQKLETPVPVRPDLIKALRERGPPMFGPRSFGGPLMEYRVQFPPGRPSSTNLQAICLFGDRRPRYPATYFPQSGFGQLKRRAAAVNNAESWFSTCCKGNQTWEQEVTLCCATQAWEQAVELFCQEDTSVKDRVYHCCKKQGSDRLHCFQKDAPNSAYQPTEDVPVPPVPPSSDFAFDPSTCQSTELTPPGMRGKKQRKPSRTSTPQNIDINFPPGRPTAADIKSLCLNRKLRPRYDLKCLPLRGYGWLARQAKTINRVERGFKQCCKRQQDVFTCADGKWLEEMDKFCEDERGGKVRFPCCENPVGQERYDCFQARVPHPGYDVDPSGSPTGTSQNSSLAQICETHKMIKKKFPVGFPLQSFVNQCCPLSSDQKTTCIQEKLAKMSESLCSARKPSTPAVRQCCRTSSQDPSQCLSKVLMDAISKATNISRQKKRKCPLS